MTTEVNISLSSYTTHQYDSQIRRVKNLEEVVKMKVAAAGRVVLPRWYFPLPAPAIISFLRCSVLCCVAGLESVQLVGSQHLGVHRRDPGRLLLQEIGEHAHLRTIRVLDGLVEVHQKGSFLVRSNVRGRHIAPQDCDIRTFLTSNIIP